MAMIAIHPRRLKTVKLTLYKEFSAIEGLMNISYWHGLGTLYYLGHSLHNHKEHIDWNLFHRMLTRAYID